jgi:CheY-specific phosphatase CheX
MSNPGLELFDGHLRSCCSELLESMSTTRSPSEGSVAPARQLVSVIGFSGSQAKGALMLRAPISFFVDTHPFAKKGAELPYEELTDWAGELANQLLGRLKNKVVAQGVSFDLSTPTTISGENMLDAGPPRDDLTTIRMTFGRIQVRLDFALRPGVEVQASPSSTSVSEGEAMLF